jgi:hypothetical protein
MRDNLPKLVPTIALIVIALCALVMTVTVLQISANVQRLYNVTAKPHCYLSPNDPRRRDIERQWGTQPTTEGACGKDQSK